MTRHRFPLVPVLSLLGLLPLTAQEVAVGPDATNAAAAAALVAGDASQVALVDVERIFNEYYRRGVAQAEIDQISVELNGRLQRARQALAVLVQQAQKRQQEVTALAEGEERTQAEEELAGQVRQAQQLDQSITRAAQQYQQAVSQRSAEVSAGIYEEIQRYIQRLAQREGLRLVINQSAVDANGLPIFPYVYDQRDLTSDIIADLNASRPPQIVLEQPDLSAAPEIDNDLVDQVLEGAGEDAPAPTEGTGGEVSGEVAVPTADGGGRAQEAAPAEGGDVEG